MEVRGAGGQGLGQPRCSAVRGSEGKWLKGKVMEKLGVEGKRLVTLMGGEKEPDMVTK